MSRWRWTALIGLYLASRLAALTALPMFLDERIHLRWAYWISQGRRLRLPFVSGRGLSVWMLAGLAPHAEDPLLAGRLLTVAVGVVSLVGAHHLTRRASGDDRAALVCALFYVVCPFTLFYDRMVLTDAFLSAATAVTALLALALAETPRLRTGAGLGLAIALGVLSKTTGLALLAVPALAVAIVGRDRHRALGPLAAAYALAAALVAYPLWLFFRKTEELGGAMALGDTESSFTGNATANLGLAAGWLWAYWTPPLVVLALIGLAMALAGRDRARPAVFLALVVLGPALAFVAASGIWYPRYLLFTTVPLLALSASGFVAAVGAVRMRAGLGPRAVVLLVAAALVVALAPALRFDLCLWTDPARAPLPAIERFQYVTGWPSGYGLRDSLAFLRAERDRHPEGLLLVTPGPSTTASAARLLWARDPAVDVRYVDPESAAPVLPDGAGRAVYVIVSLIEGGHLPPSWASQLTRAFASFKPDGAPADEVYRTPPSP